MNANWGDMHTITVKHLGDRFVYGFVLACLLLSLVSPISTHAAPPKPTDEPAPLLQPQGQSVTPIKRTPPSRDTEVFEEARAKSAIEAALSKYLNELGTRFETSAVEVTVLGDWAIGKADWKGEQKAFDAPVNILARRQSDGAWTAMLPDTTEEFSSLLEAAPIELIPAVKKNEIALQAKETRKKVIPQEKVKVLDTLQLSGISLSPARNEVITLNGMTSTPSPDQQTTFLEPSIVDEVFKATPTPVLQSYSPEPVQNPLQIVTQGLDLTPQGSGSTAAWTEYRDSREGYGLAVPDHWSVLQSSPDGFASSATLMNYKQPLGSSQFEWPAGAIKLDLQVYKSNSSLTTSDLVDDFVRNIDEEESFDPIHTITPYKKLENGLQINEVVLKDVASQEILSHFLTVQLSVNKILVIHILPEDGWVSADVIQILDTIVPDENSSVRIPESIPQPLVEFGSALLTPSVIHACDWGNEVGDSPINPLEMPFSPGTTWIVGGGGYYYGDGTHSGNDYYATDWNMSSDDCGKDVYPVAAGTAYVHALAETSDFGNYIDVYHSASDVMTRYAHLRTISISDGQSVDVNTKIGEVGTTGNSSGCHLHLSFKVKIDGSYQSRYGKGNRPSPMQTTSGSWQLCDGKSGTVRNKGNSSSCAAPNLSSPNDGFTSPGNTITFSWSHPNNCSGQNGFLVRVGTSPGGSDVKSDVFIPGLQGNIDFASQWYNRDLYWSVRANANGAAWSGSRRFRIEQSAPSCNPNADQIALYLDGDYNGQCVVKGVGNYPNPGSIGLANDQITSIKVGSNVKATLCRDDNFSGTCETFLGNDSNLSDNGIGNDQVSSVKVEGRTQVPSTPSLSSPGNGAVFAEGTGITLSWSSTGDQYTGEIWGGPGGTLSFGPQSGTSHSIGSQWAGYTYSWHIRAHNGAGASNWSNTWTFTVKPGTPTNMDAQVASCSQINLSWADNSGNEEGYKIYRNGAYLKAVGAGVTSTQDSGLSGGTSYTYYVRAYRGGIESDPSSQVTRITSSCVTTPSAPTLLSPANGEAFVEGQSISLSWSATGNQYSGQIWGGPGGTLSFGPQSGTSRDIGSQWAGYTYSWHVNAQNSAGTSGWSSTRTFTVLPAAPTDLMVQSPACDRANLSWLDRSGNEEGYKIFRNGSYIAAVGADDSDYSDSGLNGSTSYSYTVRAFRGSIDSNVSNTVSVTTQTCTPPDTEKPVANWTAPVGNGEVRYVVNEPVELSASASDNVGVTRVHFYRWDAVNLVYVQLGDDYTSPYTFVLDSGTLNLNWNQMFVNAYDVAGNVSETVSIWLYRTPPQPDLAPFAPSGYSAPVVVSSVQGTHQPDELHAGQPAYFDWHYANRGWATAPGTFYVELWVDDVNYIRYPMGDHGAQQVGGFDDWFITYSSPGWHTVRLVVDPDNTVSESDETNNTWESSVYWTPNAPYYEHMELGSPEWTATGLWHRSTGGSTYQNSTSGSTSWWYGQETTGNYDTGAANSGDLTSSVVYIPADAHYYLRFNYWYVTESKSSAWDQRWIQVSVDGGPFTNLFQLYDDNMGAWHNSPVIDLVGLGGHTLQVRFHFDTMDATENGYRGWYIDDFNISAEAPPACADTHEPNNDVSHATSIAYGQTLSADICANGDFDYYKIDVQAGDVLVVDINATVNQSALDSHLTLLDGNSHILATNDDDGMTYDSKIGYVISAAGTYYIKVRDYWHPSRGGSAYGYQLKVYTDTTDPTSAEIVNPTSGAWIDPTTQEIRATASDAGSGIQRVEFLWHSGDWETSDWIWLGSDGYGADGWNYNFDTSTLDEQQGGAFFIWAFDFGGNYGSAGVWNLGIDRTPPTTTLGTYGMYGGASFRDFHVSWAGADARSGVYSYDVQVRDGLTGSWMDIYSDTTDTYTRFVGHNGHTYYFRSRARDFAGNVGEYAEGDGQSSRAVQLCAVVGDNFENDNAASAAKLLVVGGASQPRNFHAESDKDWVKFNVQGGRNYTLSTTNTGSYADTILSLYDTDGNTLIQSNDDYAGSNYASLIHWRPVRDGTYYALVNHWDPYGYGCNTEYTLSIIDTSTNAPVISSISPDSQTMENGNFLMSVHGENFTSESVIRWNGMDLDTTWIDQNQLRTTIPFLFILRPGTAEVVVYNPGSEGGISNPAPFRIAGKYQINLPTVIR